MIGFILRRLVERAVVLLVVSFVVYTLIGLMPGDPIDLMLQADPSLTSADAVRLKALQGLDRPVVERWVGWLGRAVQGDFGYSRLYAVPAVEVRTISGPRKPCGPGRRCSVGRRWRCPEEGWRHDIGRRRPGRR